MGPMVRVDNGGSRVIPHAAGAEQVGGGASGRIFVVKSPFLPRAGGRQDSQTALLEEAHHLGAVGIRKHGLCREAVGELAQETGGVCVQAIEAM